MNLKINKTLYDKIWSHSKVFPPDHWGHWSIIQSLNSSKQLEIGPGNRPKIRIRGNHFVDISKKSLLKLEKLGGIIHESDLQTKLPFPDSSLDLICCFELLEHLPNDAFLLNDINRLLSSSGTLLISFPINMSLFNEYDKFSGHYRRYEIKHLDTLFKSASLEITDFALLNVPWPDPMTGKILSIVNSKIYPFIYQIQDLLDSLSSSVLTNEIKLKPWPGSAHVKQDVKSTTIFLKVKKFSKVK